VTETGITTQEALAKIAELAQKYQVSIIKTTYEIGEDDLIRTVFSGVFTKETYLESQAVLLQGTFPSNTQEFVASYSTGDPDQTGMLYSLGAKNRTIIQSLGQYYLDKGQVSGTYLITSTQPYDNATLTADIGAFFGIDSQALLERTSRSQALINIAVSIIVGALVLLCLVFSLVVASIQVADAKRIGVQKLHGLSGRAIWLSSLKGALISCCVAGMLFDGVLLLFVKVFLWDFVLSLVAFQALVCLIFIGISSLSLLVIRGFKTGDMVKQSISMRVPIILSQILKTALLIAVVVAILFGSTNLELAIKGYSDQKRWADYGSYYVLSSMELSGDDLDSVANGDMRLLDKFADLYPVLNTECQGIYTVGTDYPELTGADPLRESYQTLTINPNYLKEFPLTDTDGKTIEVDEGELDRVVLIPESRANESQELSGNVLKSDQSTYESDFRRRHLDAPEKDFAIHAIVYRDTAPLFSFDQQEGAENGYLLVSPVISVITEANILESEKNALIETGASAHMKFKLDSSELSSLRDFLAEGPLAVNNIKVDTIGNVLAENINLARNSLFIYLAIYLVVFFASALASVFLFSTRVLARRKWLYVARLHGLSLFARFKREFIFLGVLSLFALAAAFIVSGGRPIFFIVVGIVLLDALVMLAALRYIESKHLSSQLKGA
jgi:hypothetical protein